MLPALSARFLDPIRKVGVRFVNRKGYNIRYSILVELLRSCDGGWNPSLAGPEEQQRLCGILGFAFPGVDGPNARENLGVRGQMFLDKGFGNSLCVLLGFRRNVYPDGCIWF